MSPHSLSSAVIVTLVLAGCAAQHRFEPVSSGTDASFRGMSVVDDDIAWISGSGGTVARTTNGGRTWSADTVDGYGQFGFRSIYAFDARTAVIGNAGSPAAILRTEDGGASWARVYSHDDSSAFIDGVDFWDADHGMMYGDPIDGRMLLIRTSDGGRSWNDAPPESRPALEEGEYSFAASGTGIRCYGDQRLVISTGGLLSRLWMSEDRGASWRTVTTPILQGAPTTGIFSFAFLNDAYCVIVGGDYQRDTLSLDHVFVSYDGGVDWVAPRTPTRGYRECVEVLEGNTLVAAGPTGIDISYDGGEHWSPLSDSTGYHVVRRARSGSLTVLAGGDGKIAILR